MRKFSSREKATQLQLLPVLERGEMKGGGDGGRRRWREGEGEGGGRCGGMWGRGRW